MMDGMRRVGKSIVGRIVIALMFGFLIFSFALWGIGDIFRGYGTRTVASVGSKSIDVEPYRLAFQQELQQLSRRYGRNITTEQAVLAGIDRQVLNRLVAEAALDETAHQYKLGIPDDKLVGMITADPTFAGNDGKFDRQRFNDIIRQAGFSEQRFLNEQRSVTLRQQIAQALAGNTTAPAVIRDALNHYAHEERKIRSFTFGEAELDPIAAPTDDALTTFFNDNKDSFRLPEYRKFGVIALRPSDLADPKSISDDEAKTEYDRVKDLLGKPERRAVRQIIFNNADEAKSASDAIKGGKTFNDIAAERNLKEADTNIGLVAERDIADKAVASAIFKLEKDQVSDVIAGTFGSVIATVGEIQPGEKPAFETVAEKIKLDLAIKKTRNTIRDTHDKIEDQRSAAKPLDMIAKELDLKLATFDGVDRAGRDTAKKDIENIPERDTLLNAVFSTDIGVDNEALATRDGGYVWFDVAGITPSRERSFDEAKADVEAAWRKEESAKALAAKAQAIVDDINKGKSIDEVAKAMNRDVTLNDKLTRSMRNSALPKSVLTQAFAVPVKTAASAIGSSPVERVVLVVEEAEMPSLGATPAELGKIETDLKAGLSDDYSTVYLTQIENSLGVKINDAVLKLAIGAN